MTYRLSDEDREVLARLIWETSRADEGTISATGANAVARAVEGFVANKVASTKRGAETLGRIVERQCRDAVAAIGRPDLIAEDGDGDWGLVWELLAELRPRAEAAEALLREGIEAFRFTREYVEPTVLLPEVEGWSWFDWCESARAALGEARP